MGANLKDGTESYEPWRNRLPEILDCRGRSAELIQESQRLMIVMPGTDVFTQASKPKAVYLLLEGELDMVGSRGKREAGLGRITPGTLCDIAACMLGAPHNFTARATMPCELVALPIDIWRRLEEEFPSVSINVTRQLCNDLKYITRQITSR